MSLQNDIAVCRKNLATARRDCDRCEPQDRHDLYLQVRDLIEELGELTERLNNENANNS